jgi:SPX domain protein involved in polyphosphate accumulation
MPEIVEKLRRRSLQQRKSGSLIEPCIDPLNFARKSTKYWVELSSLESVVNLIEPHLPVNIAPGQEREWQTISSVYFDDEGHETYARRVAKQDGASLHRVRWYGDRATRHLYVERKVHRVETESIKERFPLEADDLEAFLSGGLNPTQTKRPELAEAIQAAVLDRDRRLFPTVRTTYSRCAFQLETSNEVRVTVDANLLFSRESGKGVFGEPLSVENYVEFPFAVVEVKLAGASVEQPPDWLKELVDSCLFTKANKFSKFASCAYALMSAEEQVLAEEPAQYGLA